MPCHTILSVLPEVLATIRKLRDAQHARRPLRRQCYTNAYEVAEGLGFAEEALFGRLSA
jgi:hypothetical protein